MPVTVASWTVTFGCSWNRSRSGWPHAAVSSRSVATWYKQRLEGVVVVLVDDRDVDLGLLELAGRTHAAEATAEDEHVRTPGLPAGPGPPSRRWEVTP